MCIRDSSEPDVIPSHQVNSHRSPHCLNNDSEQSMINSSVKISKGFRAIEGSKEMVSSAIFPMLGVLVDRYQLHNNQKETMRSLMSTFHFVRKRAQSWMALQDQKTT